MGLLDKLIPNEVKKVFKPVAKLSKKFLPKEIRPFLPMMTPFLPAMGIMGQLGGPMGFAKMYGANLLGQQLADPDAEFDDLNQLAALLSGTQGGLTNTGTAANLRGMTTERQALMNQLEGAPTGLMDATSQNAAIKEALGNRSMLTKAKDLGLTGLAEASDYLTDTTKTLQQLGSGEAINVADAGKAAVMKDLFTKEGATALAKSAAVPFATGMGGVTEALQRPAIREFEKFEADEAAEIERTTTANDQERADYQMTFMRQAAIPEDEVKETLEMNDLGEYYTPPVEAAQGGIIGLKEGGMLNFGGREMDLRTGGFVPIGRQEKADDVPARLSKNEFVMTADAVRAAGGGSVNKGAQRMYDIMNKLEARA
jgi:hypothetical protein